MSDVIIAGDYSFLNFESGQPIIANSVKEIIQNSRYSIVNLEAPILMGDVKSPIPKQGPSLHLGVKDLDILIEAGFNAVTLANNHIYDYGEVGLNQTITSLSEKKIEYVGAGETPKAAAQILYKDILSYRIAIINCCEHEFSIVGRHHGGANPIDPIVQYKQIVEAKRQADYVIIIVHGGVEHFQYPTARMVRTYRYFIDVGADAVINHHQHCPCGYEVYQNKPIFYGLGNFFFPWYGMKESLWNLGYMVGITLQGNQKIAYEMFPYSQCNENLIVDLLQDKSLKDFNAMMKQLCISFSDEDILGQKLKEYNDSNSFLYKKMFEPYSGRIMNSLYRRGILPSFMNKERLLAFIDFIGCESHHERMMDYLNNTYKKFYHE